jgi:hypothetical protein
MVAVSRAEAKEANIGNPLGAFGDPTIGPRQYQCTGRANSNFSLLFSDRVPGLA